MKRIEIITKGNPFREGTGRERCWSLLLKCQTDEAFKNQFPRLERLEKSITADNFLSWAVRDGHIRLV